MILLLQFSLSRYCSKYQIKKKQKKYFFLQVVDYQITANNFYNYLKTKSLLFSSWFKWIFNRFF